MQAAHTITGLTKHRRLPVGPPPKNNICCDRSQPLINLGQCGTHWHKLGGRVGDTAASKELWGAGVRSTKAAQLHSIGQLAGWVGSCVLGTAKHGLGLATASPQHLKAH